MKIFLRLLIITLLLIGCRKDEEYFYTGDLTVVTNQTIINGQNITNIQLGLFDMRFYDQPANFLSGREALYTERFNGQQLTFEDVNSGNYFVAALRPNETSSSYRRVIQIKAGQTVTLNFFN